jgi:hypothetical protein
MRHARLIATIALLASASSVFAAGKSGPAPGANAQDEKPLVSVSGMTASDAAACVAELTLRKVVFEQAGDVTQQGCKLSGAIRLKAVGRSSGPLRRSAPPPGQARGLGGPKGRMGCGKQVCSGVGSRSSSCNPTRVEAAGHTHPALRATFPSKAGEGEPAGNLRCVNVIAEFRGDDSGN